MSNKDLGFIVICVLLIVFLWLGYWLGFVDGKKEVSIMPQDIYTAQINGRDTVIHDH